MDELGLDQLSKLTVSRLKKELTSRGVSFPSSLKKADLATLLYTTIRKSGVFTQDGPFLVVSGESRSSDILVLDINRIFWKDRPREEPTYELNNTGTDLCPGVNKKMLAKHNAGFKIIVLGNGGGVDMSTLQMRAVKLRDLNYDIYVYIDPGVAYTEPISQALTDRVMNIETDPTDAIELDVEDSLAVDASGIAKVLNIRNISTRAFVGLPDNVLAASESRQSSSPPPERPRTEQVLTKPIVPAAGNTTVMPYGAMTADQVTAHAIAMKKKTDTEKAADAITSKELAKKTPVIKDPVIPTKPAINEPVKEPVKPVKEPAKPVINEPVKPVKEPAKPVVPAKPVKEPVKPPVVKEPRTIILRPPEMHGVTRADRADLAQKHDLTIEYHNLKPVDVKPVKFPIEKRCTSAQISRYFSTLEPPTPDEATQSGFHLVVVA